MKAAKKSSFRHNGESSVWFVSIGLTTGLVMVFALVGLILVKGMEFFWPKQIVELHYQEPQKTGEVIAGKIVKKVAATKNQSGQNEWQLFLGNRDVLGQSYRYIREPYVTQITKPQNIMLIERLEYGDAIGYPLALQLKDGQKILAATHQEEFSRHLQKLLSESQERWEQISAIEKTEIGQINSRIERLRLQKKSLGAPEKNQDQHSQIDAAMQDFEKQYEALAAQSRELRQKQKDNLLVYQLPNKQERSLEIGQIVDFYYPNQLSLPQRVGFFFSHFARFLSDEPREANTEGGIFPAIFGTFVMTLLMSVAVVPFGVLAAIYLREYAKQGLFVRMVRICVNNLAGVPSIVFGVFGLGFFVYFVGGTVDQLFFSDKLPTPTFGTGGIFWAALTLALMTIPVIIVSTEEALASVPQGFREGSLALGASKWQTIQRIVLPAAAPGILTGLILAMARGAGEVAPLMLVGVVKLAPNLPLDSIFPFIHLDYKFMHLGFHIYDLGFQSPDSDAAKPMVFATTLVLIMLILLLNGFAIYMREKLRKKYATKAF